MKGFGEETVFITIFLILVSKSDKFLTHQILRTYSNILK